MTSTSAVFRLATTPPQPQPQPLAPASPPLPPLPPPSTKLNHAPGISRFHFQSNTELHFKPHSFVKSCSRPIMIVQTKALRPTPPPALTIARPNPNTKIASTANNVTTTTTTSTTTSTSSNLPPRPLSALGNPTPAQNLQVGHARTQLPDRATELSASSQVYTPYRSVSSPPPAQRRRASSIAAEARIEHNVSPITTTLAPNFPRHTYSRSQPVVSLSDHRPTQFAVQPHNQNQITSPMSAPISPPLTFGFPSRPVSLASLNPVDPVFDDDSQFHLFVAATSGLPSLGGLEPSTGPPTPRATPPALFNLPPRAGSGLPTRSSSFHYPSSQPFPRSQNQAESRSQPVGLNHSQSELQAHPAQNHQHQRHQHHHYHHHSHPELPELPPEARTSRAFAQLLEEDFAALTRGRRLGNFQPHDDVLPNYEQSQAETHALRRAEAARRAAELESRWRFSTMPRWS